MSDPGPFAWPVYLDKHKIPDKVFAQAYAALSEIERSWIKKNIAQLYALAPANTKEQTSTDTQWTCGLHSTTRTRPRDWGILLLDASCSGPAWTVAAILPALTSGVRHILAVFLNQIVPSSHLLAAVELCGVDTVCCLRRKKIITLLEDLTGFSTQGVVLNPDNSFPGPLLPNSWQETMVVWQPAPPRRMGIWSEATHQWDWPTLVWNHPNLNLEIWGTGPKKLPPGCTRMSGNWSVFCSQSYRVLGVPDLRLPEIREQRCELILTPGQEGCWYWPDLTPQWFQTRQSTLETNHTLTAQ